MFVMTTGKDLVNIVPKIYHFSHNTQQVKARDTYGSSEVSVAHIEYKKDTSEIMQKIGERINKGFKMLRHGRTIAIRGKKVYILCCTT